MRDVWVLGCGPSLREVEVPEDVIRIGTNNSYTTTWSPIYATSDKVALKRDYWQSLALCHFAAIDPEKVDVPRCAGRPLVYIPRPERPMLKKSGVFAYWLALKVFKAERVHLLGYDMEAQMGHHDGKPAPQGETFSYTAQRERLHKLHREFQTETWIWFKDRFIPLDAIPGKEQNYGVNQELQARGIWRYTYHKDQPLMEAFKVEEEQAEA